MEDQERSAGRGQRATDGLDWRLETRPPPPLPSETPVAQEMRPLSPEPRPSPAPQAPAQPAAATRRSWPLAFVVGALLVGALAGGAAGGLVVALLDSDPATVSSNGAAPGGDSPGSITVERTDAVMRAAATARPSVVRIESTRRTSAGTEQDVGSGVVLDDAGHIVTNAHVVLGTETLRVILPDGSQRVAILIGHDAPFTDVAVLQIGPGGLEPIKVGQSTGLSLGETVLAIGNPLADFEGSVTVGVVSGLDRRRIIDGVLQPDLIQTDAALNQGNSGGALVNLEGEFVGMPTSVLRQSRTGQAVEGIGFALPSNRLLEVANRIITQGGSIPRPSLGIEHLDVTAEVTSRFRLAVDEGALVADIAPGGPAAVAGFERGDVVTQLGDIVIDRSMPFLSALASHEPGETVRVVLNRNGRIIETDVRLGTRS